MTIDTWRNQERGFRLTPEWLTSEVIRAVKPLGTIDRDADMLHDGREIFLPLDHQPNLEVYDRDAVCELPIAELELKRPYDPERWWKRQQKRAEIDLYYIVGMYPYLIDADVYAGRIVEHSPDLFVVDIWSARCKKVIYSDLHLTRNRYINMIIWMRDQHCNTSCPILDS